MSADLLQHGKRVLERLNIVLKGHVLSLNYCLLAVLVDRHLDRGRKCRCQREKRLATAINRKEQKRRRPLYVLALLPWHLFLAAAVDRVDTQPGLGQN